MHVPVATKGDRIFLVPVSKKQRGWGGGERYLETAAVDFWEGGGLLPLLCNIW